MIPDQHVLSSPLMATLTSSKTMDHHPPHFSQCLRKSTWLLDFIYSFFSYSFASFLPLIHNLFDLLSYREAVFYSLRQQAMIKEPSTLHKTDTRDLVPLPLGKSAIGSCLVYKIKIKSNGSIEQYKAQLVVMGFS